MFLLFLVSCRKALTIESTPTAEITPHLGIISPETATDIAQNFFKMCYENVENRDIAEQETVSENGKPYFYIFNYKQGGFLILSAENGEMPILANSTESKFPLKGDVNPGVGIWLLETHDRINDLRSGKIPLTEMAAHMWADMKNHTYKSSFETVKAKPAQLETRDKRELPRQWVCDPTSYLTSQMNALIYTTWGQGEYYNAQCPVAADGPDGHCVTGCMATAMAQIMKYHNFPTANWNFNIMPSFGGLSSYNSEVANLMLNCGIDLGMSWGSDKSGTSASGEKAFEHNGYSTDTRCDSYNDATTIAYIRWGMPVLLSGYTSETCIFSFCFGSGKGHGWIGDGYRTYYNSCYGESTQIHMNWGWDGLLNGYYRSPDPLPTSDYRYKRTMLFNIHP